MIDIDEAFDKEGGPRTGEKVYLGLRRITRHGVTFTVGIPQGQVEARNLKQGEMVEVVLTRTGIVKPKQNRTGNPLFLKIKKGGELNEQPTG